MKRISLGFSFLIILGCLVVVSSLVQAQGNQVVSRDAIGLRVSPNPERYSPLQWYNANIKIKGSPQSFIVDGYEAVRDGRTVYVNAANLVQVKRCIGGTGICQSDADCAISYQPALDKVYSLLDLFIPAARAATCVPSPIPELYTNIYIISYNQDPEVATTDIFGQLLQYWKFNSDLKNCSNDLSKICTEDRECVGGRGAVCQPTGVCSQSDTKSCLLDSDCPSGEYCRNLKSAVIRDVKRLSDLRLTKDRLETYNTTRGTYPALSQGTYLKNRTISTWPSWQTTFRTTLGTDLAQDPVNKLTDCLAGGGGGRFGSFDPITCWNEAEKQYSASTDPLKLPSGGGKYSYAYYYQHDPIENTFRLCGISESGFVKGQGIGFPLCQVNNCATCDNRQCGTDGCGHSCGTCTGGLVCYKHKCVASGTIITTEE